jgi:hypothetical protein
MLHGYLRTEITVPIRYIGLYSPSSAFHQRLISMFRFRSRVLYLFLLVDSNLKWIFIIFSWHFLYIFNSVWFMPTSNVILRLCHGSGGWSPAFQCGCSVLRLGQSMSAFGWTKWHWDTFSFEFVGFLPSILFHHCSPYSYSYITWGMNSRPVGGRSSET